jgi:hypothetical protein
MLNRSKRKVKHQIIMEVENKRPRCGTKKTWLDNTAGGFKDRRFQRRTFVETDDIRTERGKGG